MHLLLVSSLSNKQEFDDETMRICSSGISFFEKLLKTFTVLKFELKVTNNSTNRHASLGIRHKSIRSN